MILVCGVVAFIWNIIERGEVRSTLDKRGDRAQFYSEIEQSKDPKQFMQWRLLVLEHYVMAAQKKLQLFTYDELNGIEVVSEAKAGTTYRVMYVTMKLDGSKVRMVQWKETELGADELEDAANIIWQHIEEQSK